MAGDGHSLSPVTDFDLKYEKDDSDYQLLWSNVMGKGNYKNPSCYQNVEVLLLCWNKPSDDLSTTSEVERLKSVLEGRFNYHTQIQYLNRPAFGRVQKQVNAIVANFINSYDDPNTLLIVYYAGHGKPGDFHGSLELFGQTSLNDKSKRVDKLIWNNTENLIKGAEADVLEIFDCCHAGSLSLTRGEHTSFEYLAATSATGPTPVPGPDSFTSALIYALEELIKEKAEGRFTTVDLLNKIKIAPNFSKDQTPSLSPRDKNSSTGRIILHPLPGVNSKAPASKSDLSPDLANRHTLTLHFDFGDKPSLEHVETLGLNVNYVFERNTVGVNGVRWGGISSRDSRAASYVRSFVATLERSRRLSIRRQQARPIIAPPQNWQSPDESALLTPSRTPPVAGQHSPKTYDFVAKGSLNVDVSTFNLQDATLMSTESHHEEDEDHNEKRRKRQKCS